MDIDPGTFNLAATQVEAAVTSRTRAIIPVHLFGQTADMDPILAVAAKHGLTVIEDACQAIGAEDRGRRAGSMGDFGCLSFFPSKNLGGFGDGGMILTRHADRTSCLQILRNHGMDPKYYHALVGGNFRLDALQAAVLSVKMKYLDAWTDGRQRNAEIYRTLFAASSAGRRVGLPQLAPHCTRHVYNQFCIRLPAEHRQGVWNALKQAGVGCEVYYPVPLHLQKCFSGLGYREGAFPASEQAACEVLALPIFPELTREQLEYVVQTIAGVLEKK